MILRRNAGTFRSSLTRRGKSSRARKPIKNWFDHNPRDKIVCPPGLLKKKTFHATLKDLLMDTVIHTDLSASWPPPLIYVHRSEIYYLKEYAPGTHKLVYVKEISMLNFPEMPNIG